jgi:hypothetical protein
VLRLLEGPALDIVTGVVTQAIQIRAVGFDAIKLIALACIERRIRAARFPAVKSFDTFEFTANLTMNGDSYRLKQSAGRRRSAAKAEQNQGIEIIDPETGEITTA